MAFIIPRKPHRQIGRPASSGGRAYLADKGLVVSFPFTEGVGFAKPHIWHTDAMFPKGSAVWSTGRIGLGVQGTGTATDFFGLISSGVSVGVEQPLPLSVEIVFEAFAGPSSLNSIIWHNDAAGGFSGFYLGLSITTGALHAQIGDRTGSLNSDRFAWRGTEVIATNTIYHVIASVGAAGAGNAQLFINGREDPISTTLGTATVMDYAISGSEGMTVLGGTSVGAEGFDGRVYMLNYFNRRIFATEAAMRANQLFRSIRAPQRLIMPAVTDATSQVLSSQLRPFFQ